MFWIVACSSAEKSKENTRDSLNIRLTQNIRLCEEVSTFDVPDNLKFGSFDSLIKLVDELGKFDSQVESIVRRVERQFMDLDPNAELSVRARSYDLHPLRSFHNVHK
jgi:V-type H+-transporting ATPase subunit C